MDYDFAVIGGGSAGYAAARTASGLGLRTVIIEGGEEVGGLCALRGCMPSKTLIESANRYGVLRRAKEFGLRAEQIAFHADEIVARKRRLVAEFVDYRRQQLEDGAFTFIRAMASFENPHTLRLRKLDGGEETITARSFVIATGSSISVPPIPGLAEADCLTSDVLLDLGELPESVIVLGAGPVALEMAHYLRALEKKVTVIQRSEHFLKGVDTDVARVIEKAFRTRGTEVFTKTRLLRIERDGDVRRVVFEHEGVEKTVTADAILNALGRSPNVGSLNLPGAEVTVGRNGVSTDLHQQTAAKHIFAAGDCCGPYEVVHVGIQQGELAARNAARVIRGSDEPLESMDYRLKLYVVFTEPEVAVVGMTEAEATAQGLDVISAKYPFDDHGKSIVMGEPEGFVKLIVDKATREILGGEVAGPHASDLIHEIVVAMRFHCTAGQLALIPHYHPTLSEIWQYPAEALAES